MRENFDVIIEPNRPPGRYWRELLGYRELFFFPGLAGYPGAL